VTGSAGHLGEALVRVLRAQGRDVVGLDLLDSPFTTVTGPVSDRDVVRRCIAGVDAVLHVATLHKPHVGSHERRAFVDTNVTGTLTLLEEAVAAGVRSFVFTSTTSVFGRALTPLPEGPAAWITEDVVPLPRNIYGVTKAAAEDLCEIIGRDHGLPVLVLRVSRFFPEADDRDKIRTAYPDANVKANEYLYRRVDIQDVVDAALLAMTRAPAIGFAKYIISATTPFTPGDLARARRGCAQRRAAPLPGPRRPSTRAAGWAMFPTIDRVYVNERARTGLGWRPRYDFPLRARPAQGRPGPAKPTRAGDRGEGLSRRAHRPVHRPLTRTGAGAHPVSGAAASTKFISAV
jgi:nucleoside-diphosphate-sugar epimerase